MSLVDQTFVLFYLPAIVLVLHGLRRWVSVNAGYGLIVGLSLVALALASWAGLVLALGCVLIGYGVGGLVKRTQSMPVRWSAFAVAALSLIGLLGILKYAADPASDLERIILPLGLSILCVQQVAILSALVRDEVALPDSLTYARHSLFLPQLFAGPVLLPSAWTDPPASTETWDDYLARGIAAFALGLVKAAILGEEAFRFVQPYLTEASFTSLTMLPALLFLIGTALAAYFFISGFCDMAFGLGLMVGIKLPAQVDAPFRPGAEARIWSHWSITVHAALRQLLLRGETGQISGFRRAALILALLALSVFWHGDANTIMGLAGVVGLAGLVWLAAGRLPARLRMILQYASVVLGGLLSLSLLTVGSLHPWLTALSGLGSGQIGLRDVFVHDGQSVWQLGIIALAMCWLPIEVSAHALFDPDSEPGKRKLLAWTLPPWSLSPGWIGLVLALLVAGIWRAGTVRDSIYFGF